MTNPSPTPDDLAARPVGWVLEIIRGSRDQEGFQVEPRCWIVERTVGWLNRYRRLSKDYEEHPETSEVIILIAMTHLIVSRLHVAGQLADAWL